MVGDRLATVDVQAAESGEAALEAARDLAAQQAACLGAGEPCEEVVPPPALAQGAQATPEAATPAP